VTGKYGKNGCDRGLKLEGGRMDWPGEKGLKTSEKWGSPETAEGKGGGLRKLEGRK